MTPYQRGQAALAAEVDRFSNPYPMGSAEWASWRNGHNAAQTAAVHDRMAAKQTRQIGDHLPAGWEKR